MSFYDLLFLKYLFKGESFAGQYGPADIVSFDAPQKGKLRSCLVDINPIQDLHGYDKPWVGGAGKNLWPTKAYGGLGYNTADETEVSLTDKTATFDGNSIKYSISAWELTDFKTKALASGTYHVHFDATSISNPRISIYTVGSDNIIKDHANYTSSVVLDHNRTVDSGDYIIIAIGSNTAQDITVTNYQVESGSAFTVWTPWENLCPITGWTGCEVSKVGKNLTPSVRGEYIPIHVPAGTSMTASYVPNSGGGRIYYYDRNKTIIDYWEMTQVGSDGRYYRTFTTLQDAYYFQWTNDTGSQYQLEFGSTPTTYTPYNATTYPVSWQTEAGTVYGGTVDLVSGVLTVDRASVDLGTLTWTKGNRNNDDTGYIFRNEFSSIAISSVAVCSKYTLQTTGTFSWEIIKKGNFGVSGKYLLFADEYASAADFKTAMNGVQLVYELATPQTYQLDPVQVACLLGQNNVWADCGDIEVEVVCEGSNNFKNGLDAGLFGLYWRFKDESN